MKVKGHYFGEASNPSRAILHYTMIASGRIADRE